MPELFGKLETIVRLVSGNQRLEVRNQLVGHEQTLMVASGIDPDRDWFYREFRHPVSGEKSGEYVYIPPTILESSEEVAKGKAAHEGGHAAISRFGRFVPKEMLETPGFHGLMAAVEERPTDAVVGVRFPAAGEWVVAARRDSMSQTNPEQLNGAPKFAQLYSLITYAPYYTPEEFEALDQEVTGRYETVREAVERIAATLPPQNAPEDSVIERSKQRYIDTYQAVWPHIQELLATDTHYQAMAELLRSLADPESQLRQQLAVELLAALEEILQEIDTESNRQAPAGSAEQENGTQTNTPMSGRTIEQLPESQRETLSSLYDRVPETIQQECTERAEEALQEIERQFVDEHAGLIGRDTPRSQTNNPASTPEQQNPLQNILRPDELQDIDRELARLAETRSPYDQAYDAVREYDRPLYRRLREILRPNKRVTTSLKEQGKRVNMKQYQRWKARRSAGVIMPPRIFEHTDISRPEKYSFSIVVDQSGSMSGSRMTETFRGLTLLAEVLNRLNLPFEVIGFDCKPRQYKDFSQTLNAQARQVLSRITNEGGGGTGMASAIATASRTLANQRGTEQFLLVLTDGWPDCIYSTKDEIQEAQRLQQRVVGVGLGPGTQQVVNCFPAGIGDIGVKEISTRLADLVEDIIRHPERYRETRSSQ